MDLLGTVSTFAMVFFTVAFYTPFSFFWFLITFPRKLPLLVIGAGLGYASPAVGLGCDSIREIEVVMVDGEKGIRKVRATHDNEYSDILWSFCGGGFGLGIITEVTVAYTLAEVTEFAYGNVTFKVQDSIPKQAKMIADVFDFFASPDNKHFGGQVKHKTFLSSKSRILYCLKMTTYAIFLFLCLSSKVWVGPKRFGFNGLFQGNVDNFTALMKTRDLDKYVESYNMSETEKFPIASAYFVCRLLTLNAGPKNESVWGGIADTLQNLTGRDDLVLQNFTEYNYCRDVEILDALITLGGDRQSFVSYGLHPANDPKDAEEAMDWETYSNVRNTTGKVRFYPKPTSGMLEVMLELLGEHKVDFLSVVRLASGKVMEKDSDETAFVWRDHPLMMRTPFQVLKPMWAALKQMYGAENIGGYHGLSDSFDSNWQYTYYGDNYERAGMIRAKYDILNTFGKKLTPDQIFGEPVFPPECCVCKGGKKGGKLLNCDCSTCDGDA